MTPAQALTYMRAQWAESASGFFTDATLRSYLWDAECQLNDLLECNEVSTTITTTTGTQEYSAQGYLFVKRVTYDGDKLKKIDYRDLDLLDEDGTTSSAQTGDSTHYYQHAGNIGLWPVPDASSAVKLWGVAEPAEITSASTAFAIPTLFHRYLPNYGLMRMAMQDQDDGRTMAYARLWEDNKQEAQRTWTRRRMGDKLPVVKDEYYYPGTTLGMK